MEGAPVSLSSTSLVSVCVPCYNAERLLPSVLESIIAQDYPNVEIVAVDDGSTDSTREILASFAGKVRWETVPHRGQSVAINRAVALARGAFVNFHDADDTMSRSKISLQMRTAVANPGAVVYGPWRMVVEQADGRQRASVRQPEPALQPGDLLMAHIKGWFCPPHSYLWPREVVEMAGPWDKSLVADRDGDFAMRALVAGAQFVYCPDSWVNYVAHGGPRASRARTAASIRSRARVVRKVSRLLEERGRLDDYRDALAYRYDAIAHAYWRACPEEAAWCAREARRISGKPTGYGSPVYRALYRTLGLAAAEAVYPIERRLQRVLTRFRRTAGDDPVAV